MLHRLLLLCLGLMACTPHPDLASERAALLRLHETARIAHLEKRADILVASFADSVLDIARGTVTVRSRSQNRMRFQDYFDRSDITEWADLSPPIIRMSPDGQMAYVIVQKSVRLSAPDSLGVLHREHTVFAWVELYQKQNGNWTLMAVASTDRTGAA